MSYTLYLKPEDDAREMYMNAADKYNKTPRTERDAGFDLFTAAALVQESGVTKLSQQVVAGLYDILAGRFSAYFMMPRSSISKTPLRMANSIGLIDAGYRGTLIGAVDNIGEDVYMVESNTRLFQIVAPNLGFFERVVVVEDIPGGPTSRGDGGFGSTGK